jgi:hypothetical protein
MDTIEKSKNKGHPYPLRRVLLVMLIGVAFMFWMPFVIITDNYFHWLNYVIYWGAAVVWLMPLVRWLRLHRFLPRFYRLRTVILLLGVWLLLIGGGWVITRRGLLPPVSQADLRCVAYADPGSAWYGCNIRAKNIFQYQVGCQNRYFAPECYVGSSFVSAEFRDNFPLARTINVITHIEFAPNNYDYIEGVGDG